MSFAFFSVDRGSTGIIIGDAAVSLGLRDTYSGVAHVRVVLSLEAIIAGKIINGQNIVGTKSCLLLCSCTLIIDV